MYVCVCKSITEDDLKKLAQSGMAPKDILKNLGVGDSCGICLIDAIENIAKAASHKE